MPLDRRQFLATSGACVASCGAGAPLAETDETTRLDRLLAAHAVRPRWTCSSRTSIAPARGSSWSMRARPSWRCTKLIEALARFDRDGDPLYRSVAAQWLEWK